MQEHPLTPGIVLGAAELEDTGRGLLPHRLPAWARAQCPDPQLLNAEAMPAGVRLAFRTAATVVELDTLRTRASYAGLPSRPEGVYDLVVDGELAAQERTSGGDEAIVDLPTGRAELRRGEPGTVRFAGLPPAAKDVEIWLPHNERTELVALRADAPLEPAAPSGRPVWLHHGSSISAGSNAASPTGTWVVRAARLAGVELVGLGLGGSALLDPFTARTMRDTPADLISAELGINVVNLDLMRRRAFGPAVHGFLDTIREGHPETPLLVVSPFLCPNHEHTPGPGSFDPEALRHGEIRFVATGDPAEVQLGRLTLTVIREDLARIVADRADPNLGYLDGRTLYGERDADLPLPDGLHPGPEAHTRMADRFATHPFLSTPPPRSP